LDEDDVELFVVVETFGLELAREPELFLVVEVFDPEPARELGLLRVVEPFPLAVVGARGLDAFLAPARDDLPPDAALASTNPSASWWSSSHSPVIRSRCSVDRSSL
jgi:hypothetical protein